MPPVVSAVLVSLLAVGAGWSTVLCPSAEAVVVPAETGCGVALGGGSAAGPAVVEGGVETPGTGASVSQQVVGLPEAVAEEVLSGAECSHLAGEFSDLLPKCADVRGFINAS